MAVRLYFGSEIIEGSELKMCLNVEESGCCGGEEIRSHPSVQQHLNFGY